MKRKKKQAFIPYWTGSGFSIYDKDGKIIAFVQPRKYDLIDILIAYKKAQQIADKMAKRYYNSMVLAA